MLLGVGFSFISMVIDIITMMIIVIMMIFLLVLLSQIFERSPEKRVETGFYSNVCSFEHCNLHVAEAHLYF